MKEKLAELKAAVEARLSQLMDNGAPQLLRDSMAYSLEAGGKRIRPAMNLMANELLGGDRAEAMDLACAIEMIHTYSLIHDDLPALDNDTLRRGRATNHVVFGEAQAILAGDGLLNYAYEVMLDNALRHPQNAAAHLEAINIMARAAGITGMIAGQVQDVFLEGKEISFEQLSYIHAHKTGDMITGALLSGLELCHPAQQQREALRRYGENVGLVFQIVDDVLDVTAGEELGKSRGKDALEGKTTYASLFGIEQSMRIAKEKNEEAKKALEIFGAKAEMLCALADSMLSRKK